jgi:catechol 2,3-dioxygenase-like lactoylglutathione lyase family enzyme
MTAPSKFAHIVYRTHRYDEMIDWYTRVFEATMRYRDERFAFLSYDDEHHRMAFVNLGSPSAAIAQASNSVPGVHHVAYTWRNLDELLDTYKRLARLGIRPVSPVRHGMTLSFYYADPDGNGLEFQIDLLDERAATAFMHGPVFARNPGGESFDPDALIARYESGRPVDDLIFIEGQPEFTGSAFVKPRGAGLNRDEVRGS